MFATARGRWLLFALLYFAEGAPVGWIWYTLTARLKQDGVAVDEIGTLAATLALPWAFKFLWAPLVDLLQPRVSLRAWIVTAQLGMAATLAVLLTFDPAEDLDLLLWVLLAHAFCAATQDVAIDALAIRSTPVAEQGRLNGAMQTGMICGRVLFSSGVFWLGLSHRATVGALCAMVLVTTTLLAFVPTPPHVVQHRPPGRLRRCLRVFLLAPRWRWLALFALVGGAGFEATGGLASSWFVDRGLDDSSIGAMRLLGPLGIAGGALAGGLAADRHGALRTAAATLLVTSGLVLVLVTADQVGALPVALATNVAVNVALGAFTAASYALFMGYSKGPMAATAFSAMMGFTNLCESWATKLATSLAASSGYPTAMAIPAGLSLLALLALRALRRPASSSAR